MKREERRSCFRIASQSQSARDSSVLLELFLKERLYEMKKDLITVLFKLFLILLLAEGICYAYEGFVHSVTITSLPAIVLEKSTDMNRLLHKYRLLAI